MATTRQPERRTVVAGAGLASAEGQDSSGLSLMTLNPSNQSVQLIQVSFPL